MAHLEDDPDPELVSRINSVLSCVSDPSAVVPHSDRVVAVVAHVATGDEELLER